MRSGRSAQPIQREHSRRLHSFAPIAASGRTLASAGGVGSTDSTGSLMPTQLSFVGGGYSSLTRRTLPASSRLGGSTSPTAGDLAVALVTARRPDTWTAHDSS